MVPSLARPLSSTCKLSCRASRLEICIITKGNMRVLHDMMGKLPTVEVSLIKSCLQYTQRGSNPMPIPGRHQASVRGGNPVDFLMFSAIQTLSARQSHHRGSQKVYCGSQHTRVLGRHSSFIAQLRRCHGSQGASSARAHTGKTCSRLPLDGALSAEVFGIFEKKICFNGHFGGEEIIFGLFKKKIPGSDFDSPANELTSAEQWYSTL